MGPVAENPYYWGVALTATNTTERTPSGESGTLTEDESLMDSVWTEIVRETSSSNPSTEPRL